MQTVKITPRSRSALSAAGVLAGTPWEGGALQGALARAGQVCGDAAAEPDDRTAVEAALCGHITVLAAPVRARANTLWRGDVEWDRLTARLDDLDHVIRRPLRERQPPTRAHLTELVSAAQWLLGLTCHDAAATVAAVRM